MSITSKWTEAEYTTTQWIYISYATKICHDKFRILANHREANCIQCLLLATSI